MIVRALSAGGADVSFVEIESDKGHDAFLLDEPEFDACMAVSYTHLTLPTIYSV